MAVDSIAVPPDAKRDAAAAELLKTAHLWPVFTLKKPHGSFPAGTTFRRAPGSRGASYLVNSVACECPDYQRSSHICKHIRAMVLLEDRQRQAARPATNTTWRECQRKCGALVDPLAFNQRYCSGCWERLSLAIFGVDDEPFGTLNPLAE